MRKILLLAIIAILLFLSACGPQVLPGTTTEATSSTTTATQETTLEHYKITTDPISEDDLRFLKNGKEIWRVPGEIPKNRIRKENRITGWRGDEVEYDMYKWLEDNTIIVACNYFYDSLSKDKDYFYVCRVSTKNPRYKTPRNIHVGSTLQDVKDAYGRGSYFDSGRGIEDYVFYLNGDDNSRELCFYFNENKIVNKIDLFYFSSSIREYPDAIALSDFVPDSDYWP